jgi:hypothetical protein
MQPTWEAPPPSPSGFDWTAIAQALRENPEQWLKLFDSGPASVVNAIRQGSIRALRPMVLRGGRGGFEVRTTENRPGPPRTATCYLRYVPGEE